MGRNKTQSLEEMTRACLEGKVAPEVLYAPKTSGDHRSNGQWPDIYSRSIAYIMRNVVGKPWADHLVLVAGVLSAQRYDPSTVKNCLYSINARLTDFFQEKQVRSLDEWDAEECMIAYLKGELLPKDTQGVRDRFCSYYLTCVKQVKALLHTLPPIETFSYDEGSDPEHGIPAQERLSFHIWNRRSFVLAHRESYKTWAYYYYKNRYYEKHPSRPPVGETQLLLEFVKADRLNDDAPPESLWFLELFELDVVGSHPIQRADEEIATKKQWFQAWGYLDGDKDEEVNPFYGCVPGVLHWPREDGTDLFVREARKRTGCLFLPVESLYVAATFGVLSVDVFTTTGMRMNEILQLRLVFVNDIGAHP